ncbi:MAG: UDP-N-acetylglucosamine 2-epimerase, partial [Clostridia bacterium]|nr:UDP-N-acetylglucosamine 2-epimerase [Clostridia bacterium]
HKNERVRELFAKADIQNPRLHVCEPLDYHTLIYALCRSAFLMTDSGGLCEEAAYLGIPALILREHTERGESIDDGCAMLATTDGERIVSLAARLWRDETAREALSHTTESYGTGGVSEKIAAVLRDRLRNE